MYVKVSLLSIKDRLVDVLEESYQNIHFGSEQLFGTKFFKYRGSSAYAVFETLEKQPCKQKTV